VAIISYNSVIDYRGQ